MIITFVKEEFKIKNRMSVVSINSPISIFDTNKNSWCSCQISNLTLGDYQFSLKNDTFLLINLFFYENCFSKKSNYLFKSSAYDLGISKNVLEIQNNKNQSLLKLCNIPNGLYDILLLKNPNNSKEIIGLKIHFNNEPDIFFENKNQKNKKMFQNKIKKSLFLNKKSTNPKITNPTPTN